MKRKKQTRKEHAVNLKKSAEKPRTELEKRLAGAEKEAQTMRKNAQELLDGAEATSDYVMRQLEEAKKRQEADKFLPNAKKAIRSRVRECGRTMPSPIADYVDDEEYVLPRALEKGDAESFAATSAHREYLLDDPDKNGAVNVRMGAVKMRVNVKDLKLLEDAESVAKEEKNKRLPSRAHR